MRRVLCLLAGLMVVACADERGGEGEAPASPASQLPSGDGGFALVLGSDTLATEQYSRSGSTLEGELRDTQNGGRLTWDAAVGPDERITRMDVAFYEGDAAEPSQTGSAEFRGDTLIAETRRGGGEPELERLPMPEGTMLAVANSIATLEQVVRRARSIGGEDVEIPVLIIGREDDEPIIQRMRISMIGSDSVHVVVPDETDLRLAISADGRLQGAGTDAGIRITRIR